MPFGQEYGLEFLSAEDLFVHILPAEDGLRDPPRYGLFATIIAPRLVKKLEREEDKERMMVRFDKEDPSGACYEGRRPPRCSLLRT